MRSCYNFFKKNYFYLLWPFVSFMILLMIESLWRGSLIEGIKFITINYLIMIVNLIIIMIFFAAILIVKRKISFVIEMSFILLLGAIFNKYVFIFRGTPLNMNDLSMIIEAINIVNKYFNKKIIIFSLLTFICLGILIIFISYLECKKSATCTKKNIIILILFLVLGYGTIKVIEPISLVKNVFNEKKSYYDNGFIYSFLTSYVDLGYKQPNDYNDKNISDLKEYLDTFVIKEKNTKELNVILVQLESFFDPLVLNNINFIEDPIPNFRNLIGNYSSGLLFVPTFGGSTVRTEFEILTQTNLDYFSPNEIPYNTVGKNLNKISSLANYFNELGYTTLALHNNTEVFFNRKSVFNKFGFNDFWGIEYMQDINKTSNGWYEDSGLIPYIENTIKATSTKDFIHAITVQLHGSYNKEQSISDHKFVEFKSENIENQQLAYYLNTINKVDIFIGEVINMVDNLNEDSIVIFYSDHYPNLEILNNEEVFNADKYAVPYAIYDNIGLERKSEDMESYQLGAYLIDLIDFPKKYLTILHSNCSEESWYHQAIELLQYDVLFN